MLAACARGAGDDTARDGGRSQSIDGGRSDAAAPSPIDASTVPDASVAGDAMSIPADASPPSPDGGLIDAAPPADGGRPVDAGSPVDSGARADGGPPRDGGMCAESPCQLVAPQCGCAAGEGCFLSAGARTCATAGAGTEGSACTGSSDCARGLECVNVSADPARPAAQCARYCASDATCVGTGSLCLTTLSDGAGGSIPGVTLCTRACDPIDQTGCASGLSCTVLRETAGAMRGLTDCAGPVGIGTTFSSCEDDTDCAAGYACAGGSCTHWCNVATDDGCGLFEICIGFVDPVVIGGVEYGLCG
jgi:hypothetical protein